MLREEIENCDGSKPVLKCKHGSIIEKYPDALKYETSDEINLSDLKLYENGPPYTDTSSTYDYVVRMMDYDNYYETVTCDIDQMTYLNFYMSGRFIYSKMFCLDTNVSQIKTEFSNKYGIEEKHLQIMHYHVFLNDCATLRYLPGKCKCIHNLVVVNLSSKTPPELQDMVVPDIITVRIVSEDSENKFKEITVEIEDRSIRKPYIGGYRHKETGIEYHHAYSQTGPPKENVSRRKKYSRDTQTIDTRNRVQQMLYSRATQMNNENIFINSLSDKIITAKEYETAEQREKRLAVLQKIITIQRYYRRWKLNKCLKILCAEYRRKKESEERTKRLIKEENEATTRKNLIRKLYPRTTEEFSILYSMVERWKKAQTKRIAELNTPVTKLMEYYLLLEQEVQMLRVIDKQRHKVKEDEKIAKQIKFFETISKPIEWTGYKGLHISMDTLETQMGRKFTDIYLLACNYTISKEERIKILTEISSYLKQHNCTIGNEIVELIEREIRLLNLGMQNKNLDMLHKRIEALLLKHYQTPECNLYVTERMRKLKAKEMEDNLFLCTRCQNVKLAKEFTGNLCNKHNRSCKACSTHDQVRDPYFDPTQFRIMLNNLRRDEHRRGAHSSYAFLINETDVAFICKNIWLGKSALTERNEIEKLQLVRWDVNKEWTPWNCILLTDDEANVHLRIKNLEDIYEADFRWEISRRHKIAEFIYTDLLLLEKTTTNINSQQAPIKRTEYEECHVDDVK